MTKSPNDDNDKFEPRNLENDSITVSVQETNSMEPNVFSGLPVTILLDCDVSSDNSMMKMDNELQEQLEPPKLENDSSLIEALSIFT